jgi:hypothetical protein
MVRGAGPDGGEVGERGVQHGVGSIQLLLPPLPLLLLIVQGRGGAQAGAAAVHLHQQIILVTNQHLNSFYKQKAVLWIRICMFLALPDPHPDPLVTSTDPAPDLPSSSKNS